MVSPFFIPLIVSLAVIVIFNLKWTGSFQKEKSIINDLPLALHRGGLFQVKSAMKNDNHCPSVPVSSLHREDGTIPQ